MRSRTRKPLTRLVLAGVLLSTGLLAACNTVEGMGRDVNAGGRAIERSAE